MLSTILLLASSAILAFSYPYSQQYDNSYNQQYYPQNQYSPQLGSRGGDYQGSYQDFQGYQGGNQRRYQGGFQGGYQGSNQDGYLGGNRGFGSDSSYYYPSTDLTNYYGSQGVPQYYGYPSSASYQMTPYYQNQNQQLMQSQQSYNTPSQNSWSPMFYGNGYQGYPSQQQSSMNNRPYQNSWGQSQSSWETPYTFTKVNAEITDNNDVEGSGSDMDSSEQTSTDSNSQVMNNDD